MVATMIFVELLLFSIKVTSSRKIFDPLSGVDGHPRITTPGFHPGLLMLNPTGSASRLLNI